ncbi:MAG TPA: FtsX-like permease family protein, partial [Bryobacteraceae bacterium]|nr:FtsX-like permease family protein [Bryobacteraceae bacterium]
MFRYLSLIVKNSLRNRRRSILTIGSIAVSLCILVVLIAMYRAMFQGAPTEAQALRLVCRNRVSLTQPIPIYFRDKIQRIPGVHDVMAWQWFGGVYKDSRNPDNMFPRFGAEPDHLFNVNTEFQLPEDQKQAFKKLRTGCVISQTLADKLHFNLGDRITLVGDIFPVTLELKVVGIFDEPSHVMILYFNREYLREALPVDSPQRDTVGAFLIQADSPADVPRVAEAVDREFETTPFQTKSESEKAFQLSFLAFLGNLKLFIMAIFGAVTFTILLVSGNTISMSVRERIREVGILKTLGFTPGAILGIVLGESAVISVIGGAIGCLLAAGMCSMIAHSPGSMFMPALKTLGVTPLVGLLSLGVALAIGVMSSFVPAWGASR